MSGPFFEKIVIGHNPFFGVDHLDTKRGQEREAYFSNVDNILQVIDWAMEGGASGMMMSTHHKAPAVIKGIKASTKFSELKIYPLLPYVQKYVVAANQKGMLNVILDSMSGTTTGDKFQMVWKGVKGVVKKDIYSMLSNLIQIELKEFQGLNIPCIFLHDAFTDIAVTLDMKGIIDFYHEELETKFKCRAAFATKNPEMLLRRFSQWGYERPLLMTHHNKVGFSMNPGRESCEEAIAKYRPHIMAMSTLASGHLRPDEAFEYIGNLGTIESVVVGMSSHGHVESTTAAINKFIK